MRVHRYIALFLFSVALLWGVQVHAALVDSQTNDSAQATRPPAQSSYLKLGRFYLAVGYVPSKNFDLAGVRFRVNTSGDGNYTCPAGDIYFYFGTSTPVMWDKGFLAGRVVLATSTPDADGNCNYTLRDKFEQKSSISVSRLNYYVFLMVTDGSTAKWVSMSGKP